MTTLQAKLEAAIGDRYTVDHPLDGGGMSAVFAATERALGRRVVIKILPDAARALDADRFRQEIMVSAGLQHPHIVPVHAAGEVDGVPYFVMPFVEGVSLRDRLKSGPCSPAEATRVLRDVAAALQYAHSRGLVHRDLKPENVMLSGGSAVVLDFGVAKALAAGARQHPGVLTGAGYAVGTPKYMAPEQAAGDPDLDHRADIYAFGLLAFEMCTGSPPFDGTPSEVLRKHIAQEPPDLHAARKDLPAGFADLVNACLAKDPSARPQSAALVLDALDGAPTPMLSGRSVARTRETRRGLAQLAMIPALYIIAAGSALAWLFHLAAQERVREGIVAAGVIGSLIGLPMAIAAGAFLRLVSERK